MSAKELIESMGQAIELARIDARKSNGDMWDQMRVDPEEARLFARAALKALHDAGYETSKGGK